MKTNIVFSLLVIFALSSLESKAQDDAVKDITVIDHTNRSRTYSPIAAGLISYVLPGGGQFYCREPKRGLAFLGAHLAGGGIVLAGFLTAVNNPDPAIGSYMAFGSGILIMTTTSIWSIMDAVKIAKRKNEEYHINHNLGLGFSPNIPSINQPILGLKYCITF